MTAHRKSADYPNPTVTWHGPVADGRGTWKVIVRHGCRVAHLDRLTEEQYLTLLETPSLTKPTQNVDGPARVAALLERMGMTQGGTK